MSVIIFYKIGHVVSRHGLVFTSIRCTLNCSSSMKSKPKISKEWWGRVRVGATTLYVARNVSVIIYLIWLKMCDLKSIFRWGKFKSR